MQKFITWLEGRTQDMRSGLRGRLEDQLKELDRQEAELKKQRQMIQSKMDRLTLGDPDADPRDKANINFYRGNASSNMPPNPERERERMRQKALGKADRRKRGKFPSDIDPNRPGKWLVIASDGYEEYVADEFPNAHQAWSYAQKKNATSSGLYGGDDYEVVHEDDYEPSEY